MKRWLIEMRVDGAWKVVGARDADSWAAARIAYANEFVERFDPWSSDMRVTPLESSKKSRSSRAA